MHFDDLPLHTYEAEVFSECGAWKNFGDLEDSLTLEELLELYDASMERQIRFMKTVASAMGADVSDIEDKPSSFNSDDSQSYNINGANDLGFLPMNVGYDIME